MFGPWQPSGTSSMEVSQTLAKNRKALRVKSAVQNPINDIGAISGPAIAGSEAPEKHSGQEGTRLSSILKAVHFAKAALIDHVGAHPAALAYLYWEGKVAPAEPPRFNTRAEHKLKLNKKIISQLWRETVSLAIKGNRKHWHELGLRQIELIKKIGLDRNHLAALAEFVTKIAERRFEPSSSEMHLLSSMSKAYRRYFEPKFDRYSSLQENLNEVYEAAVTIHLPAIRAVVDKHERKHVALQGTLFGAVANGFVNALDNSDLFEINVSAYVVQRMNGAAIDEIRKLLEGNAFSSRSMNAISIKLDGITALFEKSAGRKPSVSELSALHGAIFERSLRRESVRCYLARREGVIELDALRKDGEGAGDDSTSEFISDESGTTPFLEMQQGEIESVLRIFVSELPEAEQDVIRRYFGIGTDDRKLSVVGAERGVTESRISQILASGAERIRARLEEIIGKEEVAALRDHGYGKRSDGEVSLVGSKILESLEDYLRKAQISPNLLGLQDAVAALSPAKSPGIVRAIDRRREEQFARKLAACLPVSIHMNSEFFSGLSGEALTHFRSASYEAICFFVYSTCKVLTGEDRRSGFMDRLAPEALMLCWPLVNALCHQRGAHELSHAFDAITTVHAVHRALGAVSDLPRDGMHALTEALSDSSADAWAHAARKSLLLRNSAIAHWRDEKGPFTFKREMRRIVRIAS